MSTTVTPIRPLPYCIQFVFMLTKTPQCGAVATLKNRQRRHHLVGRTRSKQCESGLSKFRLCSCRDPCPIPRPLITEIGSRKCASADLCLALSRKLDRERKKFEFHVRHWLLTRSWKCPTIPLHSADHRVSPGQV